MSKSTNEMKNQVRKDSIWRKPWIYLGIVVALIVLAVVAMQIPAIQSRVRTAYANIYNQINKPDEKILVPPNKARLAPKFMPL